MKKDTRRKTQDTNLLSLACPPKHRSAKVGLSFLSLVSCLLFLNDSLVQHLLITALVLNYKEPLQTVRCVHALLKQSVADRMEIIVIDNHSDDDSIGILRNRLGHIPQVRVIEANRNAGFGGGYGYGLRQITGEYVLINNPAKILQPDAVELMVKRIEKDTTIGIIAPKLIHEDGSVRSSARAFPRIMDVIAKRSFPGSEKSKNVRRYLQSDASTEQERETDWVIGGCMLVRREVLEKTGGFDPRFFLFFEDIDLCRRVHQAGYKILYFPEAIATDRKQRYSDMPIWQLPFKKAGREHIVSAVKYFAKWAGS